MATFVGWSTFLDQSTDAAFRTWGSELSAKFALVGMVQTADTGQVNWTTVTRAAVINTAAGYEIWKLSSGNLYFKIEYGTGGTQPTIPSLWITVGTGSNGSGTLTGQTSTRSQLGNFNTAPTSTVTNYQSYLCANANYMGLSWKIGSASIPNKARSFVTAQQTVDNTGAATSVGYMVGFGNSANTYNYQCVATALAVTGTLLTQSPFFVAANALNPPTSTLDGAGNNQAFLGWFSILGTTRQTPLLHTALGIATDLTLGTTASMTLVGSTPHTYINASNQVANDACNVILASGMCMIMLYE